MCTCPPAPTPATLSKGLVTLSILILQCPSLSSSFPSEFTYALLSLTLTKRTNQPTTPPTSELHSSHKTLTIVTKGTDYPCHPLSPQLAAICLRPHCFHHGYQIQWAPWLPNPCPPIQWALSSFLCFDGFRAPVTVEHLLLLETSSFHKATLF